MTATHPAAAFAPAVVLPARRALSAASASPTRVALKTQDTPTDNFIPCDRPGEPPGPAL